MKKTNFYKTMSVIVAILGLVGLSSCENEGPSLLSSGSTSIISPVVTNLNLSVNWGSGASDIDAAWTAASDTATPSAQLQYAVYYAQYPTDLSSVAAIEANGTLAAGYTAGMTSATFDPGITDDYNVNVIVKNTIGLKTAYQQETIFFCFSADTKILLADGTSKRIDQLKVGDKVKSFGEKGELTSSKIERVLTREVKEILRVETSLGVVQVTGEHPFYVGANDTSYAKLPGFKPIRLFKKGDSLKAYKDGHWVDAKITKITKVSEKIKVYNLHNHQGPSTYFAAGFGVHNK